MVGRLDLLIVGRGLSGGVSCLICLFKSPESQVGNNGSSDDCDFFSENFTAPRSLLKDLYHFGRLRTWITFFRVIQFDFYG